MHKVRGRRADRDYSACKLEGDAFLGGGSISARGRRAAIPVLDLHAGPDGFATTATIVSDGADPWRPGESRRRRSRKP